MLCAQPVSVYLQGSSITFPGSVGLDSYIRPCYLLFALGGPVESDVRWVLAGQLWVTLLVAVIAFFGAETWHAGFSALLGGLIGVVSSAVYAWRAMRGPFRSARQAFRAQQMGELFKLASTIMLFALTFLLYREMVAVPLFLAYVSTLAVYWAALLKTN